MKMGGSIPAQENASDPVTHDAFTLSQHFVYRDFRVTVFALLVLTTCHK
jgi:hypothetical protein